MTKYSRTKTNKPKNKIKQKAIRSRLNVVLKGGKFLGEGSYGCVVSPAISCKINKSRKLRKSSTSMKSNNPTKPNKLNTTLDKSVSKIIIAPTKNDKDEISISNKLKQLDPKNKYFITFQDACYIKQMPDKRSNTVKVEFDNDSYETYDILDNKKYDKEYCPIDLRLKPINLIMPYGGYDLLTIIDKKQTNPNIILIRNMLFKNFKLCFRHLLFGIKTMHDSRIVNRDIKKENIMMNYTLKDKKGNLEIKYIDFGLSSILTPAYCQKMSNIDMRGTEGLISPELIISYYMYDNRSFDKIKTNINKYIKTMLKSFNDNRLLNNFDNSILELYKKIQKEFTNNVILNKFFGSDANKYDGYLQKGDIFAIGVTIYELLDYYKYELKNSKVDNTKLFNLLQNMVCVDPEKRYNVLECLKHSYFTGM